MKIGKCVDIEDFEEFKLPKGTKLWFIKDCKAMSGKVLDWYHEEEYGDYFRCGYILGDLEEVISGKKLEGTSLQFEDDLIGSKKQAIAVAEYFRQRKAKHS